MPATGHGDEPGHDDLKGGLPPIAICVPARNEASELPNLFAALDRLERPNDQRVTVCLLLDSCTDDSVALALEYQARARFPVVVAEVEASVPNAGRARCHAMALGICALADETGILLTTDADSSPMPDWLRMMTAALQDADVVAGKVVRTTTVGSPLLDRLECYYDALFAYRRALDPVPWEATATHHYASGANLAIGVQAYRALGGFSPVASGEDARLVDDAARAGLRVRRDPRSIVETSDRRTSAIVGLAHLLRQLDGGDIALIEVAHPEDVAWQYRMHAFARSAFATNAFAALSAAIRRSVDHIERIAQDCPNDEAFAMRIVPTPPHGMRQVSLPCAEAELLALRSMRCAA